jgi:hypothetical protein
VVPKPRTELQNKVCQQLFGKSYADFIQEAFPLRKRLGQSLTRRVAGTTGANAAEGDVIRLDYKKITPGRTGDYFQLEQDFLRLREAQVKAGKMKAWSVSSVVLPQGTEREYDAFTVHIGKDLEQVLSGVSQALIAAQLTRRCGMALRTNDVAKTVRSETRLCHASVAAISSAMERLTASLKKSVDSSVATAIFCLRPDFDSGPQGYPGEAPALYPT